MSTGTKPVRDPKPRGGATGDAVRADAALFARPSAWACRAEGAPTRVAPGAPGAPPRWADAAKDGVGTALSPATNSTSLVWFTIARGILTEVFPKTLTHDAWILADQNNTVSGTARAQDGNFYAIYRWPTKYLADLWDQVYTNGYSAAYARDT